MHTFPLDAFCSFPVLPAMNSTSSMPYAFSPLRGVAWCRATCSRRPCMDLHLWCCLKTFQRCLSKRERDWSVCWKNKTNRKAMRVENVCGLLMFTVVEGHRKFFWVELFNSRFRSGWCGSFFLDETWCCSILTATEDIFMKSLAAVSGTSLSCHNCLVETHCGNCHGIQSREETNVLLWSPTAASFKWKKEKYRQLRGEAFERCENDQAIWGQNCRPSHQQQHEHR